MKTSPFVLALLLLSSTAPPAQADFTNVPMPNVPGTFFSAVAWGDYDGNGRLDFLLTGVAGQVFPSAVSQLWRNTLVGFNSAPPGVTGVYDGSVAWADYDNAGRLDFLLTGSNLSGTSIISQVWRNTGSGFSQVMISGLPGVSSSAVAWGDYDNDGRLDFLLTGLDSNGLPVSQLWRNTGGGFSEVTIPGLPAVYGGPVAWGDYDNDGRLDFLLTGADITSTPVAELWHNTGGGFTNVPIADLPGVSDGAAAWGDFDNDGWLDFLLTGADNTSTPVAELWRNTGGGFTNVPITGLPGVQFSSVAWGDYDNDGRLDFLICGDDGSGSGICQLWRNITPVTNVPPAAPGGLSLSLAGTYVALSWDAASDTETPATGLTYNVRVGTSPGGTDALAPMSLASGHRLLPQDGNAQHRLTALFRPLPGQPYYWSVQPVDTAFAGSAFSAEREFTTSIVLASTNGMPVIGDSNGDGIVDKGELRVVLSNYWPYSPWLYMTNVAGLGGTNVTFALTNSTVGAFSVEYTTNLSDWHFLGLAAPRYEFTDTNAPAEPQRYYRLRWP